MTEYTTLTSLHASADASLKMDGRTDGRVVANNYGRRSINMEDGNTFAKGMTEKIRLFFKKKSFIPLYF